MKTCININSSINENLIYSFEESRFKVNKWRFNIAQGNEFFVQSDVFGNFLQRY